jgi:PAP2 superfamily
MSTRPLVRRRALAAAREVLIIVLAAFVYAGVRILTEGDSREAEANGRRILRLEHALHIQWESGLQAQVLAREWLATLADWVYIWGFWPVLAAAAIFLYARHRDEYVLLRNAVFISGLIGFVFFALMPVAPPRLADPSVVDTIREHTTWYRTMQPIKLTNQYAAIVEPPISCAMIAPISAIPSEPPTCREEFRTAEPTPALSAETPLMAAAEAGVMTAGMPMPPRSIPGTSAQ